MKYSKWIAANVVGDVTGRCAEVTEQMAAAFPELRRVRGHYHCWAWGDREHWWLVAPDGLIVDPTEAQFPSKGSGQYTEWDESRPEPTGICLECGEYCFNGDSFCCQRHERSYMAYLQTGIL